MLIWNPNCKINQKLREKIEEVMQRDDVDIIFEGFSADLSNYAGFRLGNDGIYQTTGKWKFFPTDWVVIKEEKAEQIIEFLEKNDMPQRAEEIKKVLKERSE